MVNCELFDNCRRQLRLLALHLVQLLRLFLKMAKVQLGNVVVLDNPSPFLNPFQFELTFECIEELKEGKFGE